MTTSDLVVAADLLLGTDDAESTAGPGWVRCRDGVVVEVGEGNLPEGVAADARGAVLSPGFVDMHCHGGGGASFTDDDTDDGAAVDTVVAAHAAHGTTSLLASLVTASIDRLADQVARLAGRVEDGTLAGLHLEGPWLSPDHHGAHAPGLLVAPTRGDVARLLDAARGTLRMVTLAPELPGADEAIGTLTDAGVTVAIGHTAADGDAVRAAVDAGARVVTHLCNAMPPLHHRSPGPIPAMLADPRLTLELIADGVHVHPEVIELVARAAAGDVALVSDAMAAAAGDDGDYLLGELSVQVRDGIARTAGTGSIAGSTLTLDRAVEVAVTAGLTLADAVRAATRTPADTLGLPGGRLAPGAPADLVLLDAAVHVQQVWRAGVGVGTA